jgi:isoleucyl-tRNA synthetase
VPEQSLEGLALSCKPLGENARLLTLLSEDQGVIRLAVPGARRPRSSLAAAVPLSHLQLQVGGRSGLRRVRQLKVLRSYSGLAQQLEALAAAQALNELCLALVPNESPAPGMLADLLMQLGRLDALVRERGCDLEALAIAVQGSVHLLDFVFVPEGWKDPALAAKWSRLRDLRRAVTGALERARVAQEIGSSLQAAPVLHVAAEDTALLSPELWAELCITSGFGLSLDLAPSGAFVADGVADAAAVFHPAPGVKCDRCWRVLPEVGECSSHPTLCRRCDAVVEAL